MGDKKTSVNLLINKEFHEHVKTRAFIEEKTVQDKYNEILKQWFDQQPKLTQQK